MAINEVNMMKYKFLRSLEAIEIQIYFFVNGDFLDGQYFPFFSVRFSHFFQCSMKTVNSFFPEQHKLILLIIWY